jgi:hypothetical protein
VKTPIFTAHARPSTHLPGGRDRLWENGRAPDMQVDAEPPPLSSAGDRARTPRSPSQSMKSVDFLLHTQRRAINSSGVGSKRYHDFLRLAQAPKAPR